MLLIITSIIIFALVQELYKIELESNVYLLIIKIKSI